MSTSAGLKKFSSFIGMNGDQWKRVAFTSLFHLQIDDPRANDSYHDAVFQMDYVPAKEDNISSMRLHIEGYSLLPKNFLTCQRYLVHALKMTDVLYKLMIESGVNVDKFYLLSSCEFHPKVVWLSGGIRIPSLNIYFQMTGNFYDFSLDKLTYKIINEKTKKMKRYSTIEEFQNNMKKIISA
jgi:hypothetical protein